MSKKFVAIVLAFGLASSASAQNIDVRSEVGFVEAHFAGSSASNLRTAQELLLRQGAYEGSIDGEWGRQTERAFSQVLQTYIAIGGNGSDWGVNSPGDTARFLDWLAAAVAANGNGVEFPD